MRYTNEWVELMKEMLLQVGVGKGASSCPLHLLNPPHGPRCPLLGQLLSKICPAPLDDDKATNKTDKLPARLVPSREADKSRIKRTST